MCGSMVDIQSVTAENTRGKKKKDRKKKPQGKNIMACPVPYGGHKKKKKPQDKNIMSASATQGGHNGLFTVAQASSDCEPRP